MDDAAVGHRTSDFEYDLPPELIAQTPPAIRGESRLMVVGREDAKTQRRRGALAQSGGEFGDRHFADLPDLIPPGDLLVLNTTRVRHARLLGRRASGAPAEVLLLYPAEAGSWIAMGKPGSALRAGKRIDLGSGISVETLEELDDGYRRVRILGATADEAMDRLGRIPLPPYIERDPTPEDAIRYQTVFAERHGSVAAPTAGLHFTRELLDAVEERGVRIARIDLEVGPGTFKPVDGEDPARHPMHPERFEIPALAAELVADTRRRGNAVWAAGTTVVRALESAALEDATVRAGRADTRLMIMPGFRFRVVDRLVTNFHLPRSTLLMLAAAFAGYDVTMAAYKTAVERRYRFYSYGDAMLLQRER
jgi:S-adenosylmethionine:tRNA ribosyltransferase-isomerase